MLDDTQAASRDEYDSFCRADPEATTRWAIWRRNGAWRPVLFQKVGYACELWAPIKAEIPRRFTGPNELPGGLEKLQRDSLPNDAFASPDGRMVLGDYGGSLQLRLHDAGGLQDPLLTLPDGQVVMLRWVTGAQLRQWDVVLRHAARIEARSH